MLIPELNFSKLHFSSAIICSYISTSITIQKQLTSQQTVNVVERLDNITNEATFGQKVVRMS